MAIPIKCPGCQAAFDVPDTLAGKTIRCTSCKTQLTVPAILTGEPAAPARPAAGAATKPTVEAKAKPAAPAPAKSGPPAKSAADMLPAKSSKPVRRRDDDDEDDEDEDDRPARKRRKPQKSSGQGGMIFVLGGGVLALCAVIGVVVFVMMGSGDKKETAGNSDSTNSTNSTTSADPAAAGAGGTTPANGGGTANATPTAGGTGPAAATGMTDPMGTTTTDPAMPPAGMPPAGGWVAVQGDGFSFEMPSKPQEDGAVPGAGPMPPGAKTYMLMNGMEEALFFVRMSLPAAVTREQAKVMLTAMADKLKTEGTFGAPGGFGRAKKSEVQVNSVTDINQDGHPGIEVAMSERGGGSGGGRMRFVVAGTKLIMYGGASDKYAAYRPTVDRLIGSVKIIASPPAVAMGPNGMQPGADPAMPPGGLTPGTDPAMPPVGLTPGTDPAMPPMPNPGGMTPGVMQPGNTPPPPPPGALSSPPLAAKIDPFFAVAFDADKGEAYTISPRPAGAKTYGTLRRYSYPDFKLKGQYKLPTLATRAVLDSEKGLLYVATANLLTTASAQQLFAQQNDRVYAYVSGDVAVFDLGPVRAGGVEEQSDLKPVTTIPMGSTIRGLELAADGKSLYVAVTRSAVGGKGAKKSYLRAVDTTTRKQLKEKELPNEVLDMCLSADKSQLLLIDYPTGKPSGVLAFDPAGWVAVKTHPVPGTVLDIAPTKSGRMVASVGPTGGTDPTGSSSKLHLLDGEGRSTEIPVPGWKASANFYADFSPDGRHLFVTSASSVGRTGATAGLDVYDAGNATDAKEFRLAGSVRDAAGQPIGGYFHVGPGGTHLVFHSGAVLEVEKLTSSSAVLSSPNRSPGGNGGLGGGAAPALPAGVPVGENLDEKAVVGKWSMKTVYTQEAINKDTSAKTLDLRADGTYTLVTKTDLTETTDEGTYKVNGNTIEITRKQGGVTFRWQGMSMKDGKLFQPQGKTSYVEFTRIDEPK